MIKSAGRPDCGAIRRVEAKEIDAGLVFVSDVGPDIEFREARQSWEWRNTASADSAHPEGYDADPALPIESVESKLCRNEGADFLARNWPMSKQQIVPGLFHDPRAGRQWPWAVIGDFKKPVHHGEFSVNCGQLSCARGLRVQGGREMIIADSQLCRVPCEHSYVTDCECGRDAETF
jgi:hypothetical protein